MGNFHKDLKYGNLGEFYISSKLQSELMWMYIGHSPDGTKGWDMSFSTGFRYNSDCNKRIDDIVKVECKTDKHFYKNNYDTGNIVVEISSNGNPSGIKTTTSDYWINLFQFNRQIWIIETKKLKELINLNPWFPIIDMGDGARGYQIPRAMFSEWFWIII